MMKKVIKSLAIIVIFVIVINVLEINDRGNCVKAMSDVSESLDSWEIYTPETPASLEKKVGVIVSVIRYIGMIISVITLMVIGIKYMIGSVEERANYKQVIIPWIVGAILVFGITAIPTIVYDISQNLLNEKEEIVKPPINREDIELL